jgi:hypothetical protein
MPRREKQTVLDLLLREYGGPTALITHCPTGAPAVRIFRYQTLWGTWPLVTDLVRGLWYVAFGAWPLVTDLVSDKEWL